MKLTEEHAENIAEKLGFCQLTDTYDGSFYYELSNGDLLKFAEEILSLINEDVWTAYGKKEDWE